MEIPSELADRMDKIVDLMNRGNFRKAYEKWDMILKELIEIDPQPHFIKAETALNQAICAIRIGKATEAMETAEEMADYYETFVGDDSDEAQRALFILAEAAVEAGDPLKAIEASDRALNALKQSTELVTPRSVASTALKRAWMAERLKTPDLADDAVDFALSDMARRLKKGHHSTENERELLFQKAQLFEIRAKLRWLQGKLDEAAHDFEAAISNYEKAWGKGDETSEDALKALHALRSGATTPPSPLFG